MKVLIIDAYKGSIHAPKNLYRFNSFNIKQYLELCGHSVDLIWSHPSVNEIVQTGYDSIVFNNLASGSSVDFRWIKFNSNAKLFYVTNDRTLKIPRILQEATTQGASYTVLANHEKNTSKASHTYIDDWNVVNINSIAFAPLSLYSVDSVYDECVYYGSFRKGSVNSYKKYLSGKKVVICASDKHRSKFEEVGVLGPFADEIDWSVGIARYGASLYIEDDDVHNSCSFFDIRFYEALSYGVVPLIDSECKNVLKLTGYQEVLNNTLFVVDSLPDLNDKVQNIRRLDHLYGSFLDLLRTLATQERLDTLETLASIITK